MTEDDAAPLAVLDDPNAEPVEPTVWEKYNENYEFPISVVVAPLVFMLVVVVGLFLQPEGRRNTKPVPVIALDGDDDSGLGMAGKGGVEDPITKGEAPKPEEEKLALPENLPEIKEDLKKLLDDPTSDLPIPDSTAAALNLLDRTMLDKIMGIGQRKGSEGAGSGDGAAGTGNGGFGSDSTKARGLRWVLAFRTTSGRDYLNQIDALKGVVLVPVPPENKKMLIFKDLKNPKPNDYASDNDIGDLSSQIQFSDMRTKSCEAIQEALHLNFTPSAFWAFFPKAMEEQMARMEVAYNNKPSTMIKETKFQVIFAGGQARLNVISQKLK